MPAMKQSLNKKKLTNEVNNEILNCSSPAHDFSSPFGAECVRWYGSGH